MKIIRTIQSRKTNNIFFDDINGLKFNNSSEILNNIIKVDSSKKYQTIKGFGGAITEAAIVALNTLPNKKKEEAINAYFSKDGLNYNLGRLHINSCDFSRGNYCYVNDNDNTLDSFNINHDLKEIIPFVKEIQKKRNNDFYLLASPWSPPAYMKDNKNMNYGGKILEEYKQLWANYYVKYIQEMAKHDIKISMITIQNEPLAIQTWDSCIYSDIEERDFIKNYLGPTFKKYEIDTNIYVWDHNRGNALLKRAITILDDEEASQYVHGLAFHWYCSEDFKSLSTFHELYPDKELLFTEGCIEYGIYKDGYLKYENGEFYAHHMINDFNNYSTGFIDWNLYLDEKGGINHVNNFCEAPIMIDKENQKIIYNASYYYIGHFSKFVNKGARRILSTVINDNNTIEAVGFKNLNGEIVVIVLNKGWIEPVSLIVDKNQINVNLPNQSITTFIIK